MTAEEAIEARHQALLSLVQCAMFIRERDSLIRQAAALGITKTEIARILGMNRAYVTDIANGKTA